jgi:hypothetical protein
MFKTSEFMLPIPKQDEQNGITKYNVLDYLNHIECYSKYFLNDDKNAPINGTIILSPNLTIHNYQKFLTEIQNLFEKTNDDTLFNTRMIYDLKCIKTMASNDNSISTKESINTGIKNTMIYEITQKKETQKKELKLGLTPFSIYLINIDPSANTCDFNTSQFRKICDLEPKIISKYANLEKFNNKKYMYNKYLQIHNEIKKQYDLNPRVNFFENYYNEILNNNLDKNKNIQLNTNHNIIYEYFFRAKLAKYLNPNLKTDTNTLTYTENPLFGK